MMVDSQDDMLELRCFMCQAAAVFGSVPVDGERGFMIG
jgi:hypothetical protein